jgi:hypothetical protein
MLDQLYKIRFMDIYTKAISAGYSGVDARNFAELEITGKLFHEEINQSDSQSEIRSDNNQANRDCDSSRSPESSFVF